MGEYGILQDFNLSQITTPAYAAASLIYFIYYGGDFLHKVQPGGRARPERLLPTLHDTNFILPPIRSTVQPTVSQRSRFLTGAALMISLQNTL
ncbi:MAG: hypothetical protein FWD61_19170 [Phycisphaerales bacterium]|nr:hypothetical protein [Phycisphaerales bacterium]